MSINIPQVGNPKPIILNLSTTTKTNIYTSSTKLRAVFNSMIVCNHTAGAVTFTLSMTDNNGATVEQYHLKSVPANDSVFITQQEIPIPNGWSLDITATSANALYATAVVVEVASTQG